MIIFKSFLKRVIVGILDKLFTDQFVKTVIIIDNINCQNEAAITDSQRDKGCISKRGACYRGAFISEYLLRFGF